MIALKLPWPPSANKYWRVYRGQPRRSPAARAFRDNVIAVVLSEIGKPEPLTGNLGVSLRLFPPDHRQRDVDNVQKPILDALEHAGLYANDNQVSELHAFRDVPEPPGAILVELWQINAERVDGEAARHPLQELARLVEAMFAADKILGSRAHPDHLRPARATMRPLSRQIIERAAQIEAELIAHRYSPLADP